MALQEIPTLFGEAVNTHNYRRIFEIEDVAYTFSFSFNTRIGRWVLSITNPAGDSVVTGAVIVHNVDLFSYASPGLRPRGFLICTWKSDAESAPEPGEFDLGKTSQLLYYERDEDLFDTPVQEAVLA